MKRWHVLTKLIEQFWLNQPVWGIEVGVNEGINASKLLQLNPLLKLTVIDAWNPSLYHGEQTDKLARRPMLAAEIAEIKAREALEPYKDRCEIIKAPFQEAAMALSRTGADFVFLDADHSFTGTTQALNLFALAVKPEGIIAGHDYHVMEKEEVHVAVNRYVKERQLILNLSDDYTFWMFNKR